MPEQQPQVQSEIPLQLIGSSLSTLHDQGQLTIGRQAWVVVHARYLKWPPGYLAGVEKCFGLDALRLKDMRAYALHAGNSARRRVDGAQIDGLAQLEVAGRKE